MTEILAFIACAILFGLTVFQVLLIAGAPLGKFAWGGAHTILPTKLRISSFISIILYGIFAIIILSRTDSLRILESENILNGGIWTLTVYFFIGTLMNAISRSKYERMVMTPVVLLLGILCLLIALHY